MAINIDGRARELLDARNFATVCSLGADGTVHGVVVWVAPEGDRVTLNSAEGRAWPAAVRRDPRVTIVAPNADNPYEYVEIRGRVVEEASGEAADEHIDALAKKYLDADEYPFRRPGEQRIKFWVQPEAVRVSGG